MWDLCRPFLASHAGVFRGARFPSLPTNACSTKNNILSHCLWGGMKNELPYKRLRGGLDHPCLKNAFLRGEVTVGGFSVFIDFMLRFRGCFSLVISALSARLSLWYFGQKKIKLNFRYLPSAVFMALMLVGPSKCLKQII